MAGFFSKLKDKLTAIDDDEEMEQKGEEGYVELDTDIEQPTSKIIVRPFILEEFEDIKEILDELRKGNTISLINIKPLKDKDLVELKRAINKLKKTCDATEGDIAGFGEDWLVVAPNFVEIYRSAGATKVEEE
ncbi:cell division protein SepF [Nanoarchaeota archaeon]